MFLYTNRKLFERAFQLYLGGHLGPFFLAQRIHCPTRTLALLLVIGFGHPHQEIHIILSLAVQVL
jgi:hypothetical protein